MGRLIAAVAVGLLLLAAPEKLPRGAESLAWAQMVPESCDEEVRRLRLLVREYALTRAHAEIRWSKAEAERQRLEAELRALKEAKK